MTTHPLRDRPHRGTQQRREERSSPSSAHASHNCARPKASPRCSSPSLGVSQQTITAYEVGRRRIQVSLCRSSPRRWAWPSKDSSARAQAAAKRGPAPKLQQQMDRIAKLPRTRQRFVMDVLEYILGQAGS